MTSLLASLFAADRPSDDDVALILLVLGIALLLGAAYLGYVRNVVGAIIVAAVGLIDPARGVDSAGRSLPAAAR